MQFTVLVDFFSEETRSHYVEGMTYTSRSNELKTLVEQWVSEGKVAWGTVSSSEVEGRE